MRKKALTPWIQGKFKHPFVSEWNCIGLAVRKHETFVWRWNEDTCHVAVPLFSGDMIHIQNEYYCEFQRREGKETFDFKLCTAVQRRVTGYLPSDAESYPTGERKTQPHGSKNVKTRELLHQFKAHQVRTNILKGNKARYFNLISLRHVSTFTSLQKKKLIQTLTCGAWRLNCC